MPSLIQFYGPEIGTTWTHTRIFRSSTETGTYTQIVQLAITITTYFDETGSASDWYKIAFFDNATSIQGPYSTAFYAAATPTLFTNPSELRKFMQYSVTDFPNDEDVTLLLEQAHVALIDDAGNITNPKKLKYLALLLGASFVSRSLASRALSKGYVSVSLEGGNIMKAHGALMQIADVYYEQYVAQLGKDTIDYTATKFLQNGDFDQTTIDEIKGVMNGQSDALDVQNSFRTHNSK